MRRVALILFACALAGCETTEFRFAEQGSTGNTLRCDVDQDCGSHGLVCATEINECVECFEPRHCGPPRAPRCHIVEHRCVECTQDRDCPMGVCDREAFRCLPRCRPPIDCPPTFTCDRMRELCVECTLSVDCASRPIQRTCNRMNGRCVECLSADDCPLERPVCDPTRGVCAECLSARDCTEEAPVCVPVDAVCRPIE